jgi:hypothetical protein
MGVVRSQNEKKSLIVNGSWSPATPPRLDPQYRCMAHGQWSWCTLSQCVVLRRPLHLTTLEKSLMTPTNCCNKKTNLPWIHYSSKPVYDNSLFRYKEFQVTRIIPAVYPGLWNHSTPCSTFSETSNIDDLINSIWLNLEQLFTLPHHCESIWDQFVRHYLFTDRKEKRPCECRFFLPVSMMSYSMSVCHCMEQLVLFWFNWSLSVVYNGSKRSNADS